MSNDGYDYQIGLVIREAHVSIRWFKAMLDEIGPSVYAKNDQFLIQFELEDWAETPGSFEKKFMDFLDTVPPQDFLFLRVHGSEEFRLGIMSDNAFDMRVVPAIDVKIESVSYGWSPEDYDDEEEEEEGDEDDEDEEDEESEDDEDE